MLVFDKNFYGNIIQSSNANNVVVPNNGLKETIDEKNNTFIVNVQSDSNKGADIINTDNPSS